MIPLNKLPRAGTQVSLAIQQLNIFFEISLTIHINA